MSARSLWLLVIAFGVAGCGASATAEDEAPAPSQAAAAGTEADPGSAGGGDVGSGEEGGAAADDAPVTATVVGATYGFPIGTCTVTDDHVEAEAGTDPSGSIGDASAPAFVDVTWRGDDDSVASFHLYSGQSDPPAPFELYADANRTDTSWEVAVDGTVATIEAHMANELPAAQGDPDVAFHDVVIRIDCAERGFGGMPAPADDDEDATPMPEPALGTSGESQVTLTLGGTTYGYTQPGCPMLEDFFAFVVADAELTRLFVATEEATLVLPDGTTWGATGVAWEGDGSRFEWSGTMTSPAGGSEQATIEIAC